MESILSYLVQAFAPMNLFVILTGTVVGIAVGALPGFTATMGIAVLIPLTYTWTPSTALIFLGAIYCGSMYGGSISRCRSCTSSAHRCHHHDRIAGTLANTKYVAAHRL